jgi:hypothetical protein
MYIDIEQHSRTNSPRRTGIPVAWGEIPKCIVGTHTREKRRIHDENQVDCNGRSGSAGRWNRCRRDPGDLDVTLLDQWPEHVAAIRKRGIEVHLPGKVEITAVDCVFHLWEPATVRTPFDILFLLVKADDASGAVELIRPVLAADGVIVGLQIGTSVNAGARRHEKLVHCALSNAGAVVISTDIRSSKWMKLVANVGELVPSAILGDALADAVQNSGAHQLMVERGKEPARAAIAAGCTLVAIFGLDPERVGDSAQYAEDLPPRSSRAQRLRCRRSDSLCTCGAMQPPQSRVRTAHRSWRTPARVWERGIATRRTRRQWAIVNHTPVDIS